MEILEIYALALGRKFRELFSVIGISFKTILLIVLTYGLLGCDNGMSELKDLEKGFPNLVKSGLTENNLKEGAMLYTLYKMHSIAHKNKKSEKSAKKKMEQMVTDATKIKENLKEQLEVGSLEVAEPFSEYMKAATALIEKFENKKKSSKFKGIDHQKLGYCYITQTGSEFDSIEKKIVSYNVKKLLNLVKKKLWWKL